MNIINEFSLFLKNNNIMATIVATVMSTYVTELTTSFADDIVLPIIYRDADGDGKADISKLKNYEFKISGITFKIGNFITILLKVFVVFLVLFVINKNLKKNN
tara:strand:+ start:216 stop:524 length:309 start_codon:yes stop_codon:yes gene_type:complete